MAWLATSMLTSAILLLMSEIAVPSHSEKQNDLVLLCSQINNSSQEFCNDVLMLS